MSALPHNPLKAPVFAVCAVGLAIFAAQEESVGVSFVVCVALAALSVICLGVVLSGRNPRWLQAPLDRWWAGKRGISG